MKTLSVGVVGYSGQKFNEAIAKSLLSKAFDLIEEDHKDTLITVVSGLTDLGIPALAYREAKSRSWKTGGVACKKANEYECFDTDWEVIVGDEWGDESDRFLSMIDILVRVGGGKQSLSEADTAKSKGIKVYEYDLKAKS